MDNPLLGYWSEQEVYPNDPEYSDLGFRPDGSGWMYWASWSTEFLVHRFRWHVPAPGRLTARLHLTVGGEWSVADGHVTHQVEYREEADAVVELGWAIEPDSELTLDRPLADLCGTRFRPVAAGGTDPTVTAA
ncbi:MULTISPECIES: hypothetical protein [unclassified Amycolatopsis]|uniref:hypothetical protein n=1 Tax=unclassified Amycolatopsis TaxID=2618356 RepID=UPI00287507BA|nr:MULTISPECIES: hypothetical protein [unclassified Amycolatopsis]MDS0135138.1 hypothetical protein [Amycolatopsis sp. 505]MDS0143085.1 hypothetical protein [Amycolatopsis sp. CM201R]